MNKTIAFHTLGCKLNYAETSTYERGFVQAGLQVVPWEEPADVYLVNTCSVTQRSEQKCRNLIRKMHRTAPEARIIVTGCYAQLRPADLEALEGVARVFGAQEKNRVVPETLALLREETPPPAPPESVLPAYSTGERTRSFLKVQDGCDNFCAYCTVPFARGRSRNLAIAELVPQAQAIAAQGVKEIVLTGVNTGDFGRTTGESFLDLLKALDGVDGIERYRISSIEPNLISDGIIDWIASETKFQPHFHIPLQTGTDTLLKRVGRRYTTDFFAGRIDRIRERIGGHVFFGIDVIAGLPGETDEDFRQTYRFLEERIQPAYLHVFPYSRRPGTRAAAWPDQVRDGIKTERAAALEALCKRLHEAFREQNRGRKETVLWESDRKAGRMGGYTGNYLRVERPWDADRVGTLEEIIL